MTVDKRLMQLRELNNEFLSLALSNRFDEAEVILVLIHQIELQFEEEKK